MKDVTAHAVETELKFLADAEALDALLGHPALQGPEKAQTNRSIYFDTPDHCLRRSRLGVRVRDTGEGFVQTVKRQDGAGALSRGEWEADVGGTGIDAEALAATPAGALLNGRTGALAPVFSTTIERRARKVKAGGSLIEVSFDRGEVSTGERRAPIRELELELKQGDAAALFELAHKLAEAAPIRLSFESKAEQGYRLADDSAIDPREAETAPLEPDLPTGEAFQRIARSCLHQACANAALLLAVPRPEAVHQMRVGLRRLRAAFKAFEPLSADASRPALDAELKWLAGELDAARDLDVFIQDTFMPVAGEQDDPGFAPVGRRLLQAQTRAYDRALEAVQSRRCWQALLSVAAWIETGPWTRTDDAVLAQLRTQPIQDFSGPSLDCLRKAIRRRGRGGVDRLDPLSRHELRIRAKRLRYAVEFFAPLFERRRSARAGFLDALKRLQDQLGALNDIAMARTRLLPALDGLEPDVAFAAGRIVGLREGGERRLLRAAERAFRDFEDARPYWRGR